MTSPFSVLWTGRRERVRWEPWAIQISHCLPTSTAQGQWLTATRTGGSQGPSLSGASQVESLRPLAPDSQLTTETTGLGAVWEGQHVKDPPCLTACSHGTGTCGLCVLITALHPQTPIPTPTAHLRIPPDTVGCPRVREASEQSTKDHICLLLCAECAFKNSSNCSELKMFPLLNTIVNLP